MIDVSFSLSFTFQYGWLGLVARQFGLEGNDPPATLRATRIPLPMPHLGQIPDGRAASLVAATGLLTSRRIRTLETQTEPRRHSQNGDAGRRPRGQRAATVDADENGLSGAQVALHLEESDSIEAAATAVVRPEQSEEDGGATVPPSPIAALRLVTEKGAGPARRARRRVFVAEKEMGDDLRSKKERKQGPAVGGGRRPLRKSFEVADSETSQSVEQVNAFHRPIYR